LNSKCPSLTPLFKTLVRRRSRQRRRRRRRRKVHAKLVMQS